MTKKNPQKKTFRLKTRAMLLAEGWTAKGERGLFLFKDEKEKEWVHHLSSFQVKKLLGKSVVVTESRLEGPNPSFTVSVDDYRGSIPWEAFDEEPDLTKPPPPTFKQFETRRGSIKVYDDLDKVETDCSYREMDKKTALAAARFVISVLSA